MKKVCVVGSLNMDLISQSDTFPQVGETILGNDFTTNFGGKGSNQAVSCAKLGGEVHFVGAVGTDDIGERLINNLKRYEIDVDSIVKIDGASGVAQIINANGNNSIIVIPGSNGKIDVDIIKRHQDVILDSDIILLQNEIPAKVIEYVIDMAFANKKTIIYNPAPFIKVDQSVFAKATFVTPNEIECEQYFKDSPENVVKKYPNKVIVTMGEKGIIFSEDGINIHRIPAHSVEVVDTTGAGDTFNGAFAYALSKKYDLVEALIFANKAAALSITKLGAQEGMPTIDDLI